MHYLESAAELCELAEDEHNIIFAGESGCGKTEIALNMSAALAKHHPGKVTLIDADGTKVMYRARDFKDFMSARGVRVHGGEQFLDAPLVPPGVERLLGDPSALNVIDIGGNEAGAVQIGQFARSLTDGCIACMIVNPYRPFSADAVNIRSMHRRILAHFGRCRVRVLLNPHIGVATDPNVVLQGCQNAAEQLKEAGIKWHAVMLSARLWDDINMPEGLCLRKWLSENVPDHRIYRIERCMRYPDER